MSTEFTPQIEAYQGYLDMYGVPGAEEPDVSVAEEYLKKFGLSDSSYQNEWQSFHNDLFDLCKQLPSMIFKKDFEFISLLGGVTFEQKDFEQFKSCLQQIGETNFLIVQDIFGMPLDQRQRALKMKFPLHTEWGEIMSGNYISTALFKASINDYYIFGDRGEWGMYVATEYINEAVNPAGTPIRIIGFDPKYRAIFRNTFDILEGEYCENVDYIPEEERPDLKEWVPERYR